MPGPNTDAQQAAAEGPAIAAGPVTPYTDDLVLRNPGEMIREMIDCASKDGNYLLNIAPTKDGTIPGDQALRLREMGEWLRQNGERIYASSAESVG